MRIRDHFTQAELRSLLRRSNGLGWWAILVNWVMVFGALALVAVWPTPVSVVLALIVLGGRQLGFGALMHECGHGSLFASRALNQWAGKWLCAAPVAYRLDDYMNRHLAHHQAIGSAADPDLSRYRNYPVSPASFRRKLWRDLSGRTSLQFLRELIRTNGTVAGSPGRAGFSFRALVTRLHAPLIVNIGLFALLSLAGFWWLYLLWIAAFFSTYMAFSRIRNLAEHAVVPDLEEADPLKNTRTTLTRWWERLTVAPNSVNYHLEHHLLPAVPKYRLAAFHQLLQKKDLLGDADIVVGYGAVIRRLTARTQAS
jgi:fatty acid desaturase